MKKKLRRIKEGIKSELTDTKAAKSIVRLQAKTKINEITKYRRKFNALKQKMYDK